MFFSSHYRQVKLCQRNVLPLLGLAFENHQITPLWAWNSTEKPKMLQAVCGVRALHREHPACATLHGLLGLNAHQKVTGFSQRSKLPAFTMLWVDATDFLILILYLAAFLNLCVSNNSFFVASSGFSVYMIMSYANESLISSLPVWVLWFLFLA